jgi:hypothetical protein
MVGKAAKYHAWSATTETDSAANSPLCPTSARTPRPRPSSPVPCGTGRTTCSHEVCGAPQGHRCHQPAPSGPRGRCRESGARHPKLADRRLHRGVRAARRRPGQIRPAAVRKVCHRLARARRSRLRERMLQQMAQFYRVYAQFGPGIPQPVVAELRKLAPIIFGKPLTAAADVKKSSPAVRTSAGSPIP